jgi:two-component system chemotaxis response regulator CheB
MTLSRAVALAGSAGSIQAIRSILSTLPATFSAPIFVVVHVGASGRDLLADVFGQASSLAVKTAEDGDLVQAGQVYVAPADHHLLVVDGQCRLGRGPRENLSRPAIDPLFRAVGLAYGAGAVGLLLSGYMNDGAAGLADLKRCGGQTVVQSPGDADAPAMPLAALRASDVDFRAPADELADVLMRIVGTQPAAASQTWNDIALEVDIALGRPLGSRLLEQIADPSTVSCPACGGVLSKILGGSPVRYRCQVGHAYTGEILAKMQDEGLDEAVRVALRIVEERVTVMTTLAEDARRHGREAAAGEFTRRAEEMADYAETLRRAALNV